MALAVTQLMLYGLRSGINPETGSRLLAISILAVMLVLAISVSIFTKHRAAMVVAVIATIVFIAGVVLSFRRTYATATIDGLFGKYAMIIAMVTLAALVVLVVAKPRLRAAWIALISLIFALVGIALLAKARMTSGYTIIILALVFVWWLAAYAGTIDRAPVETTGSTYA